MCSDVYKDSVRAALPHYSSAAVSSLAGALAGLTAVTFTYPLELVRTRMAFRICDAAECQIYSSVGRCLSDTVRRNGLIGLYAGVGATLLGALPFEGIKFGANDFMKQRLPRSEDGKSAPVWSLLSGALAGAVAHTVTYPLDTVRRRMQISGAQGSSVAYRGIVDCFGKMVATEGVGSLFFGLSATVVRSLPNLGIQFLMYELIKAALDL